MKLDNLSSNIVTVLNEVMTNQQICKYLYYAANNPLSQPDIVDTKTLMMIQLFPFPFNPNITTIDTAQLRVYYPRGKFQQPNVVIANTQMFMDIIIPNTMYAVNDGASQLRPHEIMRLLIEHFSGKSFGTLGRIHFTDFAHFNVNASNDCLRLVGETMSLGK